MRQREAAGWEEATEGILISGRGWERGNHFKVIFQGLFGRKFLQDVFWGSLGVEKTNSQKKIFAPGLLIAGYEEQPM